MVQYNKVAETMLNEVSNADATKSAKTASVNASGVTFGYIRNQSNFIFAICIWIGGVMSRIVVPKEPLNDAEAKTVVHSYLSFLVGFNEHLTVDVVDTNLSQLEKTKTAAQKSIDSKTEALKKAIGEYNKDKAEAAQIALPSADLSNLKTISRAVKAKVSANDKGVSKIQEQLKLVKTANKNLDHVDIAIGEIKKACAKSAQAAYERNQVKVLNEVLPDLRKLDPKLGGLPEGDKKFDAASAKSFDAAAALAAFKTAKEIGDGTGDTQGKLVYTSGDKKGKEISKKDKAVIDALTTAGKGYEAATIESNQEKRITEVNTKLKALGTATTGKTDIGFDPKNLPKDVDGKSLAKAKKSLESALKHFQSKTSIGPDGKYTKAVDGKEKGAKADGYLLDIHKAFKAAMKETDQALAMAELLGTSPMSDADLAALKAKVEQLKKPASGD
jgi:hypothetical protein